MRTYKFRAFDKRIGKMIQTGIQFNNTTMELACIPDLILQQYIGLKDKNSKEIYEGDLYEEKGCMYPIEVYYDERYAEFRGRVNGEMQPDKTLSLRWHNMWGVIGNIYESPNLLES